MTNWIPDLVPDRPRYVAIADAIANDLASGKLKSGERLPPQRELAWRLGVTVGTVTRAYQEAERRGLLSGEVGRGSYLRDPAESRQASLPGLLAAEPGVLQMHIAAPPRVHSLTQFDRALAEIERNAARLELLDYGPSAGAPAYRQMGAAWLRKCGIETEAKNVVVTAGAHAGLIACLSLLSRRSDHLIAEPLTYPTLLPICRLLGLTVHAAEMDENGVVPSSIEALVQTSGARVVYLVPTLHNPTTVTLSEERRHDIVALSRRYDLTVIEDDIFRLLAEHAPPTLYSLAPERTYYITSLSKTLAPGLRVGFVATPAEMAEALALQQMICGARVGSVAAEMARIWTGDGTAERVLSDIRNELSIRRLVALNALGSLRPHCAPGALFLWLPIPEPWRPGDFARAAEARGVRVTPGSAFAVGRRASDHAVRVCFGLVESRQILIEGLKHIDRLLSEEPPEGFRALA
jgi:DNA-binding transcriptional MocR family regulator